MWILSTYQRIIVYKYVNEKMNKLRTKTTKMNVYIGAKQLKIVQY